MRRRSKGWRGWLVRAFFLDGGCEKERMLERRKEIEGNSDIIENQILKGEIVVLLPYG